MLKSFKHAAQETDLEDNKLLCIKNIFQRILSVDWLVDLHIYALGTNFGKRLAKNSDGYNLCKIMPDDCFDLMLLCRRKHQQQQWHVQFENGDHRGNKV